MYNKINLALCIPEGNVRADIKVNKEKVDDR